jgi:hypothetical protein
MKNLYDVKAGGYQDELDFALEIKAEDVTDEGFFKGYASTFNGPPDAGGDVVLPGAFNGTIERGGRNKTGIALLWSHQATQPLGIWTSLLEDKKGLAVQGQIAVETSLGRDTHTLMKMKAVQGLSIGYDTLEYEIDDKGKRRIRKLKEVELWEISLVTFPMNVRGRVTNVKAIEEAATEREMEHALREAGLTKAAAQYVVKLCRPSLREAGRVASDHNGMQTLLGALQEVNAGLKA